MHWALVLAGIHISIHAPRGGSDNSGISPPLTVTNFNPRSPWGERLHVVYGDAAGRAISIHAPRGGSDDLLIIPTAEMIDFNPRSPWGERLHVFPPFWLQINFNPRSPWGERPTL